MKKQYKYFYSIILLVILLLIAACTNDSNDETEDDTSENDSALESEENSDSDVEEDTETDDIEQDETDNDAEENNNDTENEDDNTEEGTSENEDNDTYDNTGESTSETEEDSILDDYSAEEIEYARIWLQLRVLEEPTNENLYVRHIAAGEPINEGDEESAEYPEEVTVVDGGRQAGVVTYSSNGDGTINIYNIPPRWENNADEEALQNEYQKVIEDTELVEVDTGNPEDVKKVIDEYLIIK